MTGRGRVVVVGSANIDIVVPVPRHPAGGETILGGELSRHAGGKGANQTVAAARAGGADTSFIGAVGADESAALLLASLTAAGVHTDLVSRVPAATGTALITVSPDGENAITVAPGANSAVRMDAAATARIAEADVVLAQLEVPLATIITAAAARRPGACLILNAAPSRELPEKVWGDVDILVVNEHEAADLAGYQDEAPVLAAALLVRVPAVVITLGEDGSLVAERGRDAVAVPAFSVTPVDTTGAGDTYCGVLAAALANGAELADAARLAAAAGALATTEAGAQEAAPTAAAVRALAGAG